MASILQLRCLFREEPAALIINLDGLSFKVIILIERILRTDAHGLGLLIIVTSKVVSISLLCQYTICSELSHIAMHLPELHVVVSSRSLRLVEVAFFILCFESGL